MHIFDDLLHKLEEEKNSLTEEIVGDVSSFEAYKDLTGQLKGLERAQWVVRTIRNKHEESE